MNRALSLFAAVGLLAVATLVAAETASSSAGTGSSGAGPATQKTGSTSSSVLSAAIGKENVIRLRRGETKGHVLLTINGVPEGDARNATPVIRDVPLQSAAGGSKAMEERVRFISREAMQNTSTVIWLVDVEMLKPDAKGARLAQVGLSEHKLMLQYFLTDDPELPVATTWTATASSPWIRGDGCSPLSVVLTAGDTTIASVKVLESTLANALERIGPDRLVVVSDSSCASNEQEAANTMDSSVLVPAHTSATVYLKLKDKKDVYGKFEGAVTLTANSPQLQAFNLTLQSSSWWMRFWGFVALLAGLWLSNYLSGLLIPSALRLQALRPVLAVREAIGKVKADAARLLAPASPNSPLMEHLGDLEAAVSTDRLETDRLLPPRTRSSLSGSAADIGKLDAELTRVASELRLVSAVVYKGLRVVASYQATGTSSPQALAAARQKLADLGGEKKQDEAAVLQKIEDILATLRVGAARQEGIPRRSGDPMSVREADYRIYEAGKQALWLWMVISVIVSVPILFIPNFSTFNWQDILYCLLWGAGLPTGAAALQAFTPASVASQIGLTLPKVQ